MVPNSRVSSCSSSDQAPNCCNGSYHMNTRTIAIGSVFPTEISHFNMTSLSPITFWNSDRIMTRSICTLCSFMRSFTSRFQIGDPTDICFMRSFTSWFQIGDRTDICFMRSFTSRFQIGDPTDICWVAIVNPRTVLGIWLCFTAILRIVVRSQPWQREVTERIKLYNLCIDHVTIQSEFKYWIGA